MDKQPVVLVGVMLVSSGVGFLIGYKTAEKRLSDEFEQRLEKETKGMREFYVATKKPYATPQEAVAELIEETQGDDPKGEQTAYHKIAKQYKPSEKKSDTIVDIPEQPVIVQNIFSKNERDPEFPYIISQEEYMQNDQDWQQITVTYYRGDGVLTDHREDVIEEIEKTIGLDAINNFGLQSSDPGTVHVCNEKLGLLFEVLLHEGTYTKEVLGLEATPPDLPSGRSRSDE